MIAYFVSDQKSKFYHSEHFVSIMNYVNRNQKRMVMKQKESRLSLTVSDIRSVKSSINILLGIPSSHQVK